MADYGQMDLHTDVTVAWDGIQEGFGCCGLNNYTDWQTAINGSIPMTCCGRVYGAIIELNHSGLIR